MLDIAYEIVSNIPKDSTDWGKVNYFTNWLNDNADYNYSSNATAMQYLPTSAFLYGRDTVNAPVCEGFAEALKILCNLSDVKCMCVEAIYELNDIFVRYFSKPRISEYLRITIGTPEQMEALVKSIQEICK